MIDLRSVEDGTRCIFSIREGSEEKCEGLIRVSKRSPGKFYIEQNDIQGSDIESEGMRRIKYNYTWTFTQISPGIFSEGVQIFELEGLEIPDHDNVFITLTGRMTNAGHIVVVEYSALVKDMAISGTAMSIHGMMDAIYDQVQTNKQNN